MTVQYCTPAQLLAATTGIQTDDLPEGELDRVCNRAGTAIEQTCNRSFAYNAAQVETLFSSGRGRVVIENSGFVQIRPRRLAPIVSVGSIVWTLRTPRLLTGSSASTSQTVVSSDILIEMDGDGEGQVIRIFEDFSQYRLPSIVVQFTLTYAGGYQAQPDWLTNAAILWATALLAARGPQSFTMNGFGQPVASDGGAAKMIKAAKDLLSNHVRYI